MGLKSLFQVRHARIFPFSILFSRLVDRKNKKLKTKSDSIQNILGLIECLRFRKRWYVEKFRKSNSKIKENIAYSLTTMNIIWRVNCMYLRANRRESYRRVVGRDQRGAAKGCEKSFSSKLPEGILFQWSSCIVGKLNSSESETEGKKL